MMTTAEKIRALQTVQEDFEWYPTTDEIISAMKNDLRQLFKKEIIGSYRSHDREYFDANGDNSTGYIESFLDVGAGDGRVFHQFQGHAYLYIKNAYGIEIAQPFAEDLIQRDDVFLIGRDFFRTSLMDKHYSVIFSNPPYSKYVPWVIRLLQEANFAIMYLVIPVRWELNKEITRHMERYQAETLGEYDFSDGDRPARARVNLIRLMKPKRRDIDSDRYCDDEDTDDEDTDDDSFDRWIYEHIGSFEKVETPKDEEDRYLKISRGTIGDMVESYEYEMASLLEAFKALAKLPGRIIDDLGMNKEKIIKQIKSNITKLKNTYWQLTFEKLDAIRSRLTKNTRQEMLSRMSEFQTLDFNEDNVYSIVLWVIKNFNKYTAQQILEVFDSLTSQDYIRAYKSNVHWTKDNWRYTKGEGKPDKYILDYRIVTHCYCDRFGSRVYSNDSIIEDLKVICGSLGYPVPEWERVDYSQDGSLQEFTTRFSGPGRDYTEKNEIAFTARLYKNQNAHLKINERIMLKFNVEVARLRNWINGPDDIVREYEVSEEEATKLWKEPSLVKIGHSEILQLGFSPAEKMSA
jgi:hypothetical protein